ncbi:MAG: hypothetical protein KatS3mg124_2254 [Porticoccaceae bacterium]|nr:MAG: hypothetical protein KatS3mg124_2254 [Porticoccaceae bacterium]
MECQHPQDGEEIPGQVEGGGDPQLGEELGQQAEDAEGRQVHEQRHHGHDHLVEALEQRHRAPPGLAGVGRRHAHEERKDDDLEHVALGHRLDGVGGDDPHQHFLEGRRGRGREVRLAGKLDAHTRVHQVGHQEGEAHRHRRGGEVQGEGPHRQSPHPGARPHSRRPAHQGDEDHRHHQQLQRRHEDGAEGIEQAVHQPVREARGAGQVGGGRLQGGAHRHARRHADQDPSGQFHRASFSAARPAAPLP